MKKYFILIVSIILTLGMGSCKKEKAFDKNVSTFTDEALIEKINNFKPTEDKMGEIYHKFLEQKENNSQSQKSSFVDQRIDTAIWSIETYLNSNYGFRVSDTCYKYSEEIDTITFSITGHDDNIPIVDGSELYSFLTTKESEFEYENSDDNNVFFWCNMVNVIGVSPANVTVTMNVVSTVSYKGVYPPGYNPSNFPHYTCMRAVGWGECNGILWGGANYEYERRYEYNDGSQWMSNGYIMVFDYAFYKSHNNPGVNGRLWNVPYANGFGYILNTNPPDELNQYLQSTKDMIDDFNPHGISDRFLGNIYIGGFNQNQVYPNYYTCHMVTFYIFKKVAVGLPD